jgi:hypothetical protein
MVSPFVDPRPSVKSAIKFLSACVLGLLLTSCSHYQLGTGATGKLAFHTLYLAPVENQTHLPQARELISTQLREAFARDARVTLADSPESADATLTVVLTTFRRDVASVREGDTGLARKFNLTLDATATLHDNRAARDLFVHRPLSAVREAFTDSGQLQSEYQTLPLLAETLAQKATHAVLDVW